MAPYSTNDALIEFFSPDDVEVFSFPMNLRQHVKGMPKESTGNGQFIRTVTVPKGATFTHLDVRKAVDNIQHDPKLRLMPILHDRQFGWNSWASIAELPGTMAGL